MKKTYINPTMRVALTYQAMEILSVSGNVKDKLDPPSPTDPTDGEPMSAKGGRGYFWNNEE